jgi:glucose-6-phosphate isomerase
MLTVNFDNLFKVYNQDPKHGVSTSELENYKTQFDNYKDKILSRKQGFLDLGEQNIQHILDYAASIKNKYTDIVILGIGGSMLGPVTILDTLKKQETPKVHCLDNIDPDLITKIRDTINLQTTLFLVQTKSGGTPETLAQYFYFKDILQTANLEIANHFVFITDPEKGYLRKIANQQNIPSFEIPDNVGGRFSVLTPVGLLISALVGLDIQKLLNGAKDTKTRFFDETNFEAYYLAVSQFLLSQKGKNINVFMPYSSRLKTLANWYTQLLSESVGKKLDLNGNQVFAGITPLPALGATDQHSQLQLFSEGPHDKLTLFVEVDNFENQVKIPTLWQNDDDLDYLENKTFNQLLAAELAGTKASLTENNRPNITLKIDKINEYSLGELFMFLEISVAFLGELLNINTFDQPGVERSKVLAKEILIKFSS